jgi:hypothetical protein
MRKGAWNSPGSLGFTVVPKRGFARLSLIVLDIGLGGGSPTCRAPQGRPFPRYSLGGGLAFKSPMEHQGK